MRVVMAMLLLGLLPAVAALGDVFKLPNNAQLEIFPVGRWQAASEDVGELKIILVPDDPRINARAIYTLTSEGSDDFPTEEKLLAHMHRVGERLLNAGDFVERKPVVKPYYSGQGFGFYTVMTDRKLVGLPPVPGDYKIYCLGMIRLAPSVYLKAQIMADSEEGQPYQQLLGMAEGVTYTQR